MTRKLSCAPSTVKSDQATGERIRPPKCLCHRLANFNMHGTRKTDRGRNFLQRFGVEGDERDEAVVELDELGKPRSESLVGGMVMASTKVITNAASRGMPNDVTTGFTFSGR